MEFQEDFLHYVWKLKLFDTKNLCTSNGATIQIKSFGIHNTDAGADFQNAQIDIDGLHWAGNVEIHLKSSDWHKHQHAKSYDNVILHVVYENDSPIFRTNGTEIPTLELKGKIFNDVLLGYRQFQTSKDDIPCEKHLKNVPKITINNTLSKALVERWERKVNVVQTILKHCKSSWDDTFYILIARNFGFKINALPFAMLSFSLPQTILAKHKNNPLQIDALLFGQAGMLQQDFTESYPKALQKEYDFLRKKYTLSPIDSTLWKFLRTRPQNFPSLRLAQFSSLVQQSNHLFSKILEQKNAKEILLLFNNIQVHPYWQEHYRFEHPSPKVQTREMGKNSLENIIINTISPILFAYGKSIDNDYFVSQSLELLEMLHAEKNATTELYLQKGFEVKTAFQSQAVLHLNENYCLKKRCLDCGIGIEILKHKKLSN